MLPQSVEVDAQPTCDHEDHQVQQSEVARTALCWGFLTTFDHDVIAFFDFLQHEFSVGVVTKQVLLYLFDGMPLQPVHVLTVESELLLCDGFGDLRIGHLQFVCFAILLELDASCCKSFLEQQTLSEELVVLLRILSIIVDVHDSGNLPPIS